MTARTLCRPHLLGIHPLLKATLQTHRTQLTVTVAEVVAVIAPLEPVTVTV